MGGKCYLPRTGTPAAFRPNKAPPSPTGLDNARKQVCTRSLFGTEIYRWDIGRRGSALHYGHLHKNFLVLLQNSFTVN